MEAVRCRIFGSYQPPELSHYLDGTFELYALYQYEISVCCPVPKSFYSRVLI